MNTNIEALQPSGIWKNFRKLTEIPRPSKKEGRVVEFVRNFGDKLGLETMEDQAGNIIIRKPATGGMQNRKGLILQAHLDMVPQKNNDKVHDFEKDPIEPWIDGEWVKANGTTLGADNGIGVAAILSVLESGNLVHGPLEALFTVDEETGMTGAFALKEGLLKGDILLNLDSEDEGELYIGCAGGMDVSIRFDLETEDIPEGYLPYLVQVKGLKGGHSGLDINLGRGNSNKIMFRILYMAERDCGLRLCEVDGGNMRNAIPREANARVIIPVKQEEGFLKLIGQIAETCRRELAQTEPSLTIEAVRDQPAPGVIKSTLQHRIIASVFACPHGTIRMTDGIPGLVETSTNLSIVRSDRQTLSVHCLLRSSVDSAKMILGERMRALFELAGAKVTFSGSYPGWKPNMQSPIMQVMKKTYRDMYGREPEIKAVHAGLECGIIGGIYPNLDMISFGPTIRHPHSPDEKVHIESVGRFWDFLVGTMKNIPVKN